MYWIKNIFLGVLLVFLSANTLGVFLNAKLLPFFVCVFALLAFAPLLVFMGYLFVSKPARTSESLQWVYIPSLVGAFLVVAWSVFGGATGMTFWLASAIIAAVGHVLYVFWYSDLSREPSPVLFKGRPLPDLELRDTEGLPVKPERFKGSAGLFLFYRGNWCPLCMAQIKEVAEQYQAMHKRGIELYMISPQPKKHTASLAKKFNVPMHFFEDRDNKTAKILGIDAEGGLPVGLQALGYDSDTVLPTVILTDKNGNVIFADQTDNYRIRPEPSEFIKRFDEYVQSTK